MDTIAVFCPRNAAVLLLFGLWDSRMSRSRLMKRWHKVILGVVLIIGGFAALLYTKNQPPQLADTDYYQYYID